LEYDGTQKLGYVPDIGIYQYPYPPELRKYEYRYKIFWAQKCVLLCLTELAKRKIHHDALILLGSI